MGFFDNIRKKEKMEAAVKEYFKCITAYVPRFTTFEGSIYEMELTRAAIHSFANHVSKLKPEIAGGAAKSLEVKLQYKPNALMDTKKYLYRIATEYMTDNNAFIVPMYDQKMNIVGFYPLHTKKCRLVEYEGKPFLRYEFMNQVTGAIELERVGILNQMMYGSELFGESNNCLFPTMELINTNNQGIVEGVKNSASIRFMAQLAQTLKPKDIEEERKQFRESNFNSENNGGVLLFDQKYKDVKQVESKPFTVDAEQMRIIRENVYDYFGTNEKIIRSEFNSDEWNAYYESKIEPFAIELSLVHTNMLYSEREKTMGNMVLFTSNRLQYMSNKEKLETVVQLFDRGFITHNEGREIMCLDPVEDGDTFYIRKEYAEKDNLDLEAKVEAEQAGVEINGGTDNAADEG